MLSRAKALKLCEMCTKATVGGYLHVYRAEKVQQRIIAARLPTLEIEMCAKNRTAIVCPKNGPYLALVWFAGLLKSSILCPLCHLFVSSQYS